MYANAKAMRLKRELARLEEENAFLKNAAAYWNHSLKVEAIHGERFATREQARACVFQYIEVDYNRRRFHSTLGYLSPEQFELVNAA